MPNEWPRLTTASTIVVSSAVEPEAGDEAAVDLDRLDREALEVGQRRVAGAEVVDGEVQAEAAQVAQRDRRRLDVGQQGGLGDLQPQRVGGDAGLGRARRRRASANAGSTTWRVPTLTASVALGERQLPGPPAGELGERVAQDRLADLADRARSPRRAAGTGPAPSSPRSGCSQRASASNPTTWPVVSSTIGWKYGTISPRSRPRRSSVAVRRASTVVSWAPGANASTQSRPRALARYIAASASRSRSAADVPVAVVDRARRCSP